MGAIQRAAAGLISNERAIARHQEMSRMLNIHYCANSRGCIVIAGARQFFHKKLFFLLRGKLPSFL
jgi:hypothetical protein